MTPERADEAARVLLDARKDRRTIPALPESCRPATLEEGYAVQDALVALSGARVEGWKLGATTPYWQKRAGLKEPMAGRLLEGSVHRGSTKLEGAAFRMRMVECEYAFRLGRDLPPRAEPYGRDEVFDAVDAVFGCIEVADTRYDKGLMVDTPSLVADNVLAGAYLVGPSVPDFRGADLTHAVVRVIADGKPFTEGSGEHTGGHPVLPLVWLAEDRRKRGDGLKAGQLVSTGSCTGGVRATPTSIVRAEFATWGAVEVTFG
jgi:2-keto-4-pentenoate hydratase